MRPFRDTRPLPQVQRTIHGRRCTCGSGLVSRKGCKAAPKILSPARSRQTCLGYARPIPLPPTLPPAHAARR
ncbi:hypothetical protein DBB42_26835 [Pseudomonas plecoglossicida]|uniref:Uncharacterized protein n=1 Tax=Pseudomonas plecoglossicida TaxID=70775 RepID=A0A2R7UDE0_PSEDL|nr:hypothetical protein DBB42_26835 [Pseudomonas plecoglossicida]